MKFNTAISAERKEKKMTRKENPQLTDAEIADLYRSDPKLGSEKAVEKYSGYIYYFLNRNYPTYRDEYNDMYLQGVVGLLNALRTYDPAKGALTTYSTPFIRSECNSHIMFLCGEKSDHFFRLHNAVEKARNEIEEEGRTATAEEIAEKVGVQPKTAAREMGIHYGSVDGEEPAVDNIAALIDSIACEQMLEKVDEMQKNVISLRVFENKSFAKIAVTMDDTAYNVRKKYYSGIEHLKSFVK